MLFLEAACGCDKGRIRHNNEDNFYFAGQCLEEKNDGLAQVLTLGKPIIVPRFLSIFDGMGGENYGECASFAAAARMRSLLHDPRALISPTEKGMELICAELNKAVVARSQELRTEHMGSTMVTLCISPLRSRICNIGDSRAYLLRGEEFTQLTEDHLENRETPTEKKPYLTQHLGLPPEEVMIEPFFAAVSVERQDQFLLCSDGLTDMLPDEQIREILKSAASAETGVSSLIDAAKESGGKDNITVILCRIH